MKNANELVNFDFKLAHKFSNLLLDQTIEDKSQELLQIIVDNLILEKEKTPKEVEDMLSNCIIETYAKSETFSESLKD